MVDPEGQRSVNAVAAPAEAARWEPLAPRQLVELLADLGAPWWIAGGWALDLFLGRQTRAHDDIEIAIFRGDERALAARLPGWELFIAENATLTRWAPETPLPHGAHELWARERGSDAWRLEILVEERAGARWAYRRNAAIGLNAADLGRRDAEGIPYVRPDVQLLYKSREPRAVDETDFLTVLPHLDAAQRGFLAAALWTVAPGHRWIARLK